MQRKILRTIALASFALVVGLGAAGQAQAQDAKAPYPNMAPLDQYLMPERNAEIALARSAAPESISGDAEVLVLGRHGYETAIKGKNGFVCVVERSWMSPFDFPQFWNPKMRGPICFNPPAVRSISATHYQEDGVGIGRTVQSSDYRWHQGIRAKELPALEPGAMCYMMSKQGYLNDSAGHWVPHLMFYVPLTDPKILGSGSAGLSGYVESTISRCSGANNRVHDPGAQLVRRNSCTLRMRTDVPCHTAHSRI